MSVRSKLESEKLKVSANSKLHWERLVFPSIFERDSLLTVWCALWIRSGGTAQAKMKLDMPLVQVLFFGAMIHLVQLLIRLSSGGMFLVYSQQWEIQSSRKMNHISSYSYPKLFFALLHEFQKDRSLCFMLEAMDLNHTYFIIFYLKNTNSTTFFCGVYPLEFLVWSWEEAQ